MIIQETIKVKLNPRHVKHFEDLGYFIPRYVDKQNRSCIRRGTTIEVKVLDLPPRSNLKVLYSCDGCGNKTSVVYNNLHDKPEHLCTHCRRIGYKHSNQTKKILSLKKMGNNNPCFGKFGKDNPNYNPELTDKERITRHSIPGITKWKKEVKERDDYTCQKCGSKENLHAHHKNGFAEFKEQRIDIDNGVTLCQNCHKKLHKMFGTKVHSHQTQDFLLFQALP